jgi:hypothetical protein
VIAKRDVRTLWERPCSDADVAWGA